MKTFLLRQTALLNQSHLTIGRTHMMKKVNVHYKVCCDIECCVLSPKT